MGSMKRASLPKQAMSGKDAFRQLGGVEGVRALANTLYDIMEEYPEAHKIRVMHPKDLEQTRENLTLFLSGWLGGPPLYVEKYGSVNLTGIHAHLNIGNAEKTLWLSCMEKALTKLAIEDELKQYLLGRLQIPAEKIRMVCQERAHGLPLALGSSGKK